MNGPPFKALFEDSSPSIAKALRKNIQDHVDFRSESLGKIITIKDWHKSSIRLPYLGLFPEEFKFWYNYTILDVDMKDDLQRSKVINWCRTAKKLYPIKTKGDGNCMLHSVSLAVWGIEDSDQFLRRMLYIALVNDPNGHLQKRWLLHQRNINMQRPNDFNPQYDTNDWRTEWEKIIKAASDTRMNAGDLSFETLEGIHLFALANILRRPIVLLADKTARSVYGQSMQDNGLRGIYLPLEWSKDQTCKTPIVIGYNLNHFVPLLTQQTPSNGRVVDGEYVVPLVSHDFEQLPLHFLLASEENISFELIKQYLKTKEMPMTCSDSVLLIPVASLEQVSVQDHLDLVRAHNEECEQIYAMWTHRELNNLSTPISSESENPEGHSQFQPLQESNIFVNNDVRIVTSNSLPFQDPVMSRTNRCKGNDCEMYGTPEYNGMCSECFRKYTVEFQRNQQIQLLDQTVIEPTAPPPSLPMPSINDYSIMAENCRNNCGNKCSYKTYPYCHQCHDSEIVGKGQSIHDHSATLIPNPSGREFQERSSRNSSIPVENGNTQELLDEKTLFGEGNSPPRQNPEYLSLGEFRSPISRARSSMCSTPNCDKAAVEGTGQRCTVCFITNRVHKEFHVEETFEEPSSQTYMVTIGKSKTLNNNVHRQVSENKDLSKQASRAQGMCTGQNCPNYGYDHQNNLCDLCWERHQLNLPGTEGGMHPGASQKNICATPGCKETRVNEFREYCIKCLPKSTIEFTPTNAIPPPDIFESKTPIPTRELPIQKVVTSSKDKVKCASPICGALIYPPKQLCDDCTLTLHRNHAKDPVESPRSRSLEMQRESPAKYGNAFSPSRQKCKKPNCKFYGDPKFNGFCSKCTKDSKSNTAPLLRMPQVPNNARIFHTQPHQRCVEPNCDKYGDPNMFHRCTEHFRMTQQSPSLMLTQYRPLPGEIEKFNVAEKAKWPVTGPSGNQHEVLTQYQNEQRQRNQPNIPEVQTQGYVEAMRKLEISRRSVKCKSNDCPNYGNAQKEGYCNSCYPFILQNRMMRGNVDDDYHCC